MTEQRRIVLDANILLRSVFGVRVRNLLETYEDSVSFYTPDVCFSDARKYIPAVAATRHFDPAAGLLVLDQLARLVEIVDQSLYEEHESSARERMLSRDVDDWPIVATSLLLDCLVWTEDQDFFGSGIATWTTNNPHTKIRRNILDFACERGETRCALFDPHRNDTLSEFIGKEVTSLGFLTLGGHF